MRAMGPVNSRVLMIGGSVDRWIVRFLAGGPAGPVHGGLMRLRDRRIVRFLAGGPAAHAVAGPAAHAAEDAAK